MFTPVVNLGALVVSVLSLAAVVYGVVALLGAGRAAK